MRQTRIDQRRERADLDMENQIRWVVRGRGVHGELLLREVRRSKERSGERAGGVLICLASRRRRQSPARAEEGEGRGRRGAAVEGDEGIDGAIVGIGLPGC